MKFCKQINFIVIICNVSVIYSYDTGPPIKDETCMDMIPIHDPSVSQDSINFSHTDDLCYHPGKTVKVDIMRAGNPKVGDIFNGIMIQAKTPGVANNNFGSFDIKDSRKLKVSDCFLKPKSALHHITKLNQTNLTFYWMPPIEDEGDLEFDLTIVFSYENFITGLKIPIPVCTNTTTTQEDMKLTTLPTASKSFELLENTTTLIRSTTADPTTKSTILFKVSTELLTTKTTKYTASVLTLRGSNALIITPMGWQYPLFVLALHVYLK